MGDQKNMVIAIVLSVVILLGWQFFYEVPKAEKEQVRRQSEVSKLQPDASGSNVPVPRGSDVPRVGGLPYIKDPEATRAAVIAGSPRIEILTPRLVGSIALRGGRIDDLALVGYKETLEPGSPDIRLLSPLGSTNPYYAQFGWASAPGVDLKLPGPNTVWETNSKVLQPDRPLKLRWDNGAGLIFTRTIAIDQDYMFTITQVVENKSNRQVTLFPYGLIARYGVPDTLGYYILHEGPLGVINGTLEEIDYDDLQEQEQPEVVESTGGWLGITDKYWLAALVPGAKEKFTGHFLFNKTTKGVDRFQVDYLRGGIVVAAHSRAETSNKLFAGAKEVSLLERYRDEFDITNFDLAVDFGILHFLTKPMFKLLAFFASYIPNFGISILLLTVCVKAVFFPLANLSYKSMSKMRKLQPEVAKMKERYGEDRVKMQQEMMALYKKEGANPMMGCLPMLIQIPVFFSLYKVLFVTIEMRHKPFFGWIQDLSAPDPTSVFNLFGLIPFDPPQMLMIGIWPLAMGVTMYVQQMLNPEPPDPIQAKIFKFMPVFFIFILAPFPAGLVIYWTWNNILSVSQQWFIMKRMGVAIGRNPGKKSALAVAFANFRARGQTAPGPDAPGPDASGPNASGPNATEQNAPGPDASPNATEQKSGDQTTATDDAKDK